MLEDDIKQEQSESSETVEEKEMVEQTPEEDINSIFPGATPI